MGTFPQLFNTPPPPPTPPPTFHIQPPPPPPPRELKRVAREEAARLAALRSNDYEAYLRLAQHTKDKRLRQLLDKTDDIIKELGLKVCVCVW